MTKEIQLELLPEQKPTLDYLLPLNECVAPKTINGKFKVYKGLTELFLLINPTVQLLRKFKYERKLKIIPISE